MFYLGFITEISLKFQRWFFARVQNHLQCFCELFPFCCWRSSLRHPFSPAAAMRNAGRHSRSAQRPSLFPSSLPQARKQYWAWAQANQLHGGGQMRQGGGWADTTEPCWKNGAQSTCCAEASPPSNHIFNAKGGIARKSSPWLFVVVVVLFYFGINLVYSDAFLCLSLLCHILRHEHWILHALKTTVQFHFAIRLVFSVDLVHLFSCLQVWSFIETKNYFTLSRK